MEIRCPNCGKAGKISEERQHKRIKCKACGEEFVPADSILTPVAEMDVDPIAEPELEEAIMVEEDVVNAAPLPRIPLPPDPKPEISVDDHPHIFMPEGMNLNRSSPLILDVNEPWYYRFLHYWAIFFLFLAILDVAFGSIAFLAFLGSSGPPVRGDAVFLSFLWLGSVLIGLLTCASVILLLLDLARNIRRIRINSDRKMMV